MESVLWSVVLGLWFRLASVTNFNGHTFDTQSTSYWGWHGEHKITNTNLKVQNQIQIKPVLPPPLHLMWDDTVKLRDTICHSVDNLATFQTKLMTYCDTLGEMSLSWQSCSFSDEINDLLWHTWGNVKCIRHFEKELWLGPHLLT